MRSRRAPQPSELAEGWDANAAAWIEWTRRGLDSYPTHRLAFLPLIPPPGHLTVDVGAGEGRVSRELSARGHRVVAIDSSFTMTHAASTHPDAPVPAVVADAGSLPLRDGAADCVVAFMCLQDVDDVVGAVAEVGRVLRPGGTFVVAVVHPLNSAGAFDQTTPAAFPPFVIQDAYTEARRYTDVRSRDGRSMTYHGIHRPLQTYTDALTDAGLVIRQLREHRSDDPTHRWSRIPLFLHLVAVRL